MGWRVSKSEQCISSMKTKIKKIAQHITPPLIVTGLRALFSKNRGEFVGPYATWQEALYRSTGYQDELILEKIKQSTLTIIENKNYSMRDGVVFTEPQYSFPLLACLLNIAISNNNCLHVVDIGGALGSSYYSFKQFCSHPLRLTWSIIEQSNFVDCGNHLGDTSELRFYAELDALESQPDVVLMSATLQYLDKPYQWLERILALDCNYLILDRVLFHIGADKDCILVERVAKDIYKSSYPFWLFSYDFLKAYLAQHFDFMAEFDALEGRYQQSGYDIQSKGFILRRKQ